MTLVQYINNLIGALGHLSTANKAYIKLVERMGMGGSVLATELRNLDSDGAYIHNRRNASIIFYDELGDPPDTCAYDRTSDSDPGVELAPGQEVATRDDLIKSIVKVEALELALRKHLVALHAYIYTISATPDGGRSEQTEAAQRLWAQAKKGLRLCAQSLDFASMCGADGVIAYAILTVRECTLDISQWMQDVDQYKKLVRKEEKILRGSRKHGLLSGAANIRIAGAWEGFSHFTADGYATIGGFETYLAANAGIEGKKWWDWPPALLEGSRGAAEPYTRKGWISPLRLLKTEMLLRPHGLSLARNTWNGRTAEAGTLPDKTPIFPLAATLPARDDGERTELPGPLLQCLRGLRDSKTAAQPFTSLIQRLDGCQRLALTSVQGTSAPTAAGGAGGGSEYPLRPSGGGEPGGWQERDALAFGHTLKLSKAALDDQRAAMASRRATGTAISGGRAVPCRVVCAAGDGDCAFTAVQNYLTVKGMTLAGGQFTRANVLDGIARLYETRGGTDLREACEALFLEEAVGTIEQWKEKFSRKSTWLGAVTMHLAGLAFRLNFNVYRLNEEQGRWEPFPGGSVQHAGVLATVYLAYMSAGETGAVTLNHYETLIITPEPEELLRIDRLNAEYQRREVAVLRGALEYHTP